jgi:hypothetical protein
MVRILTSILLTVLMVGTASAQQDRMPSLAEMQRQMMEMQRQMMQQLQNFDRPNGLKRDTSSSSSYFFRFDTTFSSDGHSGGFQFHFSPFGSDSTDKGMGDFFGFDQMFQDFFDLGEPRRNRPNDMENQLPKDDGNLGRSEDDLLPEERLRQKEQQPLDSKPAAPADKPTKSKIKTIRM